MSRRLDGGSNGTVSRKVTRVRAKALPWPAPEQQEVWV